MWPANATIKKFIQLIQLCGDSGRYEALINELWKLKPNAHSQMAHVVVGIAIRALHILFSLPTGATRFQMQASRNLQSGHTASLFRFSECVGSEATFSLNAHQLIL